MTPGWAWALIRLRAGGSYPCAARCLGGGRGHEMMAALLGEIGQQNRASMTHDGPAVGLGQAADAARGAQG